MGGSVLACGLVVGLVSGLVGGLAGCATASTEPEPVTAARLDRSEIAAWEGLRRETSDSAIGADADGVDGTRTMAFAPVRNGVVSISSPRIEPPRPSRGKRVDVSFERAELTHALQFLADAGRFNLVVESGLHGDVTAFLRAVDPWDALLVIARANGCDATYDRGIVYVVKGR